MADYGNSPISKVIFGNTTVIDITDTTATASDVLTGKYFYTSSGAQTQGTIAYGSEGTPIATKGIVANHSIFITPSVTNTAGVISGGTKTGDAVSVSASELVSGTYVVENGGTHNVTNYASASVPTANVIIESKHLYPTASISLNSSTGVINASVPASSERIRCNTFTKGFCSQVQSGTLTVNSTSSNYYLATQNATTINPIESSQVAVASGKYTLGPIEVAAIPSDYIGSEIAQKSSADVIIAGPTISIPSGYYASAISTQVKKGSIGVTNQFVGSEVGVVTLNSANGVINIARPQYNYTTSARGYEGYVYSTTSATGIFTLASANKNYQLDTVSGSTITPIESSQIAVASGKYTLGPITVSAIPSNYVGSAVARKSSTDLSAQDSVVIVPSGYYEDNAEKAINSAIFASQLSLSAKPNIQVDNNGLITASINAAGPRYPVQSSGYASSGVQVYVTYNSSNTYQLAVQSDLTITPTESSQIAVSPSKYTTGTVTIAAIPSDYIGSAIASVSINEGITEVFRTNVIRGIAAWNSGVISEGQMDAATFANSSSAGVQYVDISPTTEAPVLVSGGYLYINKGYTDDLKISLAKLVPDGASADLASGVILSGYAAYDNDGNLVAGNIPTKNSTNVTVAGPTVSVPSGYYATEVNKAVSSGVVQVASMQVDSQVAISVNNSTGIITAICPPVQYDGTVVVTSAGYIDTNVTTSNAFEIKSNSISKSLNTVNSTTITPTESSQIAVASAKFTLGPINVAAIPSTYVGSGVVQRSATDLSASGSVVSVPSGYYATEASKPVAAGSVGTPYGEKIITGHTAHVRAAVEVSRGYVSISGTKTGDTTNISVSELVSGTLSISSAGVVDVTNYASASVAEGVTTTPTKTITANPAVSFNSSTGQFTATVAGSSSITPTVSAGYISSGTAGTVSVSGSSSYSLVTKSATSYTPSASTQIISSGVYLTGDQTIEPIPISVDNHRLILPEGLITV